MVEMKTERRILLVAGAVLLVFAGHLRPGDQILMMPGSGFDVVAVENGHFFVARAPDGTTSWCLAVETLDQRSCRQSRPVTSAAIYARVSSARQKKDQAIGSQTAALRAHAAQNRLEVPAEWVFEDEGHSGATLVRPALEARKICYYRCLGSDDYRYEGGRVCGNKPVRADYLDKVGWDHIAGLLTDPALVRAEILAGVPRRVTLPARGGRLPGA